MKSLNRFLSVSHSCLTSSSPIRLAQGRLQRGSVRLVSALTTALAFGLSACGDDITEINANVGAIKSTDDLPACTEDIAGQTAFVKETHEFLGCDGKEWMALGANTVSVGDNVCMSKSLSDDTGFEIFCNGESIGTVKNGKDGADGAKGEPGEAGKDGAPGAKGDKGTDGTNGKDGTNGTNGTNGTGCTIKESTTLTATIACGSETFTMDLTGYVEQPEVCDANVGAEDCATLDSAISLSGVSQKGPFVTGTDITAYELQNGRTLKQTGKTFGGKIERADGTFDIKTVKLNSAFAYIVADGFYRNEVTGENSSAAIKLRALTNLKGRSSANINLVTHLEYDRVQYLVTRKDSSVTKAKMAAEEELFAAFGINNSGFEGLAEDLNVLKEGKGNAALLAISVLLQGDRNESELTALLASLSVDLGDNGQWDNAKQRAQIADWAMKADLEGRLATVRANVEGWKLAESAAPAFEQHVTNFWMNELGVDKCDSSNAGALFAVKNKNSAYYAANDSAYTDGDSSLVRLICDASGATHAWRYATDLEKDTKDWPDFADQERRAGNVNKDIFYVFEDGEWRTAEGAEVALGACNENRDGVVANVGKDFYTCANPRWREATVLEMDTYKWAAGEDGDVRNGFVNDAYVYVYDGNSWRRGSEADSIYGIGGCTEARRDTVVLSPNGSWYICRSSGWDAASDFEKDTYGWETSGVQNGKIQHGQANETFYYVFDAKINGWRRASEREEYLQLGCTSAQQNLVEGKGGNWFTCDSSLWRDATDIEKDTLGWGKRDTVGTVKSGKENKNLFYVFDDVSGKNAWRHGTVMDSLLGIACTKSRADKLEVTEKTYEGLYYVCTAQPTPDTLRKWVPVTDLYNDTHDALDSCYKKIKYADGTIMVGRVNTERMYVCDNGEFRPAKSDEISYNRACVSDLENHIFRVGGTLKKCSSNQWIPAYDGDTGIVRDVDKQIYKTVIIGSLNWMAENLNRVTANSYCYNDDANYCSQSGKNYGRLYTLGAALTACPAGWHVPSVSEFNTLVSVAGKGIDVYQVYTDVGYIPSLETNEGREAIRLKSKTGWAKGYNGTDGVGFSALPGGYYRGGDVLPYDDEGFYAYFWTSSLLKGNLVDDENFGPDFYTVVRLYPDHESVDFTFSKKSDPYAYSVRCVQD